MSVQNINGACIQWDDYTSTKDSSESFDFPQTFPNANVAVITNRTTAEKGDILPVVKKDAFTFTIDRAGDIFGDSPFNMFAIAPDAAGGSNRATTPDGAVIQWGIAETSTDGDQTFSFPTPFSRNCATVLINRMEVNGQSVLPVISANKSSFTINRPNTINGDENFFWVAIGDCDLNDKSCFSLPLGGGYIMKGGKVLYDAGSGSNQKVYFSNLKLNDFPGGCQTVMTARTKSGVNDIMPVTAMEPSSFTVIPDRNVSNNQYFYWLAIGN